MKHLCFILIFLLSVSCKHIDCDSSKYATQEEIELFLASLDVSLLQRELYIIGECKNRVALPVLRGYSNDVRIGHHALHKGISIGHIAQGAINKINGE